MTRPATLLMSAAIILTLSSFSNAADEATVELPGGASMEFVLIEPGTFSMGSPESEPDRDDWEGPQHKVTISHAFYFGRYEVTQGQWLSVMGTSPWHGQKMVIEDPRHPATYISWEDAQKFIHRLNEAAGDSLYRLPTEAEWEFACRCGTTTRWSFGDDSTVIGDYAWYSGNTWTIGEAYPHAVGLKQPNPWGLYDMHGNVWEYCQDWFGNYRDEEQTDPVGATSSRLRVSRSGDILRPEYLRCAYRNANPPTMVGDGLGVRLVLRALPHGTSVDQASWGKAKEHHWSP